MTLTRHAYAIIGLATILTAASFSSSHMHSVAFSGSAPVTVMNTTSNPVPTQAVGTTTVDGTVHLAGDAAVSVNNPTSSPVPVSVQGTPSVSVSSLPDVTVSNGVDSPVPVQMVAAQRVEGSNSGTIDDGSYGANVELAGVPVGKRLVITDVSVQVSTPSGQHIPNVSLFGLNNGNTFQHFILAFATGPDGDGQDNFCGTLSGCALRFDGNSAVYISVGRSSSSGSASVLVSYSGYLE